MSTVINNPLALYAGYMSELVSLYGQPLAPHPMANMPVEEIEAAVGDIDKSSIRCCPITPLQRLSANGALPRQTGPFWEAPFTELSILVKDYMGRSAPFVPSGEPPSEVGEILHSYETDFASAIKYIHDIGDVFIGTGTLLPLIYAAWQGASHAYIVNSDPDIARIFLPLYGSLLCMGRNRAEFLSLMSGRPLPENDEWRPKGDFTPAELFKAVKALPEDRTFESVVTGTIMRAIASRSPESWSGRILKLTENWFTQLRWTFYEGAPEIESQENPLWPLTQSDEEGRGGPLASEESFRRHRRLFLEGRVTGIGSGVDDFGLSAVNDDMTEEGQRPGVVYLSNVEDELFQELALKNLNPPDGLDISARLTILYSDLNQMCYDNDVHLISAKHLYPTTVDEAVEYAKAAYAMETPHANRDEAYKSMYPLRLAVARAKWYTTRRDRFMFQARLDAVTRDPDIGQRLQNILIQVKSIFHGNPIGFSHLKKSLMNESKEFRQWLTDSERDIFLYNMVLLGIARMPGEARVEVILPSGKVLR
jgi:hypothetical protein